MNSNEERALNKILFSQNSEAYKMMSDYLAGYGAINDDTFYDDEFDRWTDIVIKFLGGGRHGRALEPRDYELLVPGLAMVLVEEYNMTFAQLEIQDDKIFEFYMRSYKLARDLFDYKIMLPLVWPKWGEEKEKYE